MRLPVLALILLPVFAQASEQWTEVRSPHFTVVTDAGEKRGREVALRFEQMRQVFGNLVLRGEVHTSRPIQILAFKNTKGIRSVSPMFKGKVVELAGLYQKGQSQDYIALDLSSEGDSKWQTVFHEYAHLLLNSNTAEYPVWFDEGFAEFFSTIDFSGKETMVGRAPESDAELVLHSRLVPVVQMFSVRHDSATYNESGDHRSMFYAESWLIVHYLYDHKLTPNLTRYFAAIRETGRQDDAQFKQYLGMSFAEFDRTLESYIRSGSITGYRTALPAGIDAGAFTAKILTDNDAMVAVADMHANERDRQDQAIGELQQALVRDPNNIVAESGLGYAYLMKRDFEHAAPHLEKAAAAGSNDPMIHYYYAMLLQQQYGSQPLPDALLDRQKKELETALSLNPNLADAYNLLGINSRQRNDWDGAIAATQRAVMLDQRNDGYLFNLLGCYISNRRFKEAAPLIARLQHSQNPTIQAQLSSLQSYMSQVQTTEPSGADEGEETTGDVRPAVGRPAPRAHKFEIKHIEGTLIQVDCRPDGSGTVYIKSGDRLLQLKATSVAERELSCGLRQAAVTAEYTEDGVLQNVSLNK